MRWWSLHGVSKPRAKFKVATPLLLPRIADIKCLDIMRNLRDGSSTSMVTLWEEEAICFTCEGVKHWYWGSTQEFPRRLCNMEGDEGLAGRAASRKGVEGFLYGPVGFFGMDICRCQTMPCDAVIESNDGIKTSWRCKLPLGWKSWSSFPPPPRPRQTLPSFQGFRKAWLVAPCSGRFNQWRVLFLLAGNGVSSFNSSIVRLGPPRCSLRSWASADKETSESWNEIHHIDVDVDIRQKAWPVKARRSSPSLRIILFRGDLIRDLIAALA